MDISPLCYRTHTVSELPELDGLKPGREIQTGTDQHNDGQRKFSQQRNLFPESEHLREVPKEIRYGSDKR